MKFCEECGNEIASNAVICPHCGHQTSKNLQTKNNGLSTAAKIFMILGTIVMGFYLIPLLWCIPMTVCYFKRVNSGRRVGTGFKICSLLFVSQIAGILMLCDKE